MKRVFEEKNSLNHFDKQKEEKEKKVVEEEEEVEGDSESYSKDTRNHLDYPASNQLKDKPINQNAQSYLNDKHSIRDNHLSENFKSQNLNGKCDLNQDSLSYLSKYSPNIINDKICSNHDSNEKIKKSDNLCFELTKDMMKSKALSTNEMSDTDTDSLCSYGSKPETSSLHESSSYTNSQSSSKLPDWLIIGESIRISPDSKTGVIAFIGPTNFAPGIWVGVVLDTPQGKNDGSVNGIQYFSCKPKYGIFVKADKLKLDPRGRSLRSAKSNDSSKLFLFMFKSQIK